VSKIIVKLSLWVALCGFLLAYLAFTIGNVHVFQHNYKLSATFDDVTGMLQDDNVKVAGVVVGKVTGVHIENGRARVNFQVHSNVKIPTDSTAAVRWRNLLGQRYLYLYPGTASTMLKDGDSIKKTRSVVDIGELFNRLGPIVKAIDPKQTNEFLDGITAALQGNQDKLRQTIDDLSVLTKSLAQRDAAIGRVIDNTNSVLGAINSRDAEIRQILDNLLTLSSFFSANTDALNGAITDLGDFSSNMSYLLTNNRGQLDRIIAYLNTLTDEVRVKLPQINSALGGLDEAAKRLFNASADGEWLNQIIPCGAIGRPAVVALNSCVESTSQAGPPNVTLGGVPINLTSAGLAPAAASPSPTTGAQALAQLLGGAQ
jgi:phospholipid/cholesterol/gamma-HCH transport system substrate-binding protein